MCLRVMETLGVKMVENHASRITKAEIRKYFWLGLALTARAGAIGNENWKAEPPHA